MKEQEIKERVAGMWADLREDGAMVVDAPARKIGMPWVVPYEGVCFPVEIDGHLSFVVIPADEAKRFALEILALAPVAMAKDRELDAEIATHDAIGKAKAQ